jgi:hypothetical protein
MKKLLACLFLSVPTFAVTNGQVNISSGTGFYTVDISSTSAGNARQNITIADPTLVPGLATVDPLTGLTVHLATSSANQPVNFSGIAQPVLAATGTATVITTGSVVVGPLPAGNNSLGNVNIVSSGPVTTVSTGSVVVGPLPAGQNSLGVVNIISSQPVVVITTGVATQPVTGTFFQSVQPISYGAGSIVSLSTTQVVNSTFGLNGVIADSSPFTLGTSPGLPMMGVFLPSMTPLSSTTTAAARMTSYRSIYITPMDANGVILGTGTANPIFVIDAPGSNSIGNVNIISSAPLTTVSTGSVVVGPLPAGSNSLGTVNIISSAPVNTVSTGSVVVGPLPGGANSLGVINIISSQPVVVITTGVATQAVTGTFFQTVQPISFGAGSIVSLSSTTVVNSTAGAVQVGPWYATLLSTPPVTVTNSTSAVVGMYSDNGVSSATNRVTTLPGVYQNGASAQTARTQGRDAALSVGTDGLLWTSNQPAMRPYSYSASTNSWSIATSTNDVMALCGNPTDTVRLYGIRFSCNETTPGAIQMAIVKRGSAYSGVWSTMVVVSQSSKYAGSISTATFFTSANLVVGTLVGYLDSYKLGCMAAATAVPGDLYISPRDWLFHPIILNSASECVAVNVNGATISGGTGSGGFDYDEVYPNGFNP